MGSKHNSTLMKLQIRKKLTKQFMECKLKHKCDKIAQEQNSNQTKC